MPILVKSDYVISGTKASARHVPLRTALGVSLHTESKPQPFVSGQKFVFLKNITITKATYTDYFFKFHRTQPNIKENFLPVAPIFTITREKLIVKLNTAPRIPVEEVKPILKVTDKNNNMTTGNETTPNKNLTTTKNLVSQVYVMHVMKFESGGFTLIQAFPSTQRWGI